AHTDPLGRSIRCALVADQSRIAPRDFRIQAFSPVNVASQAGFVPPRALRNRVFSSTSSTCLPTSAFFMGKQNGG
ncbi:MAG TPA: hypothetical protein VNC50_02335, partial [Planctomycetia bacterium]|nr:hypothetical protein [Planctomycetia bacterium]